MNQPYITIAMPCRNEAGFIEACLRSVQAQTYPRERIEILVADGGSTDGTREILARLAAEDSRIRVIDNPAAHPGGRAQPRDSCLPRGSDRAHGRARGLRPELPREVRRGPGPGRARTMWAAQPVAAPRVRSSGPCAPPWVAAWGSAAPRSETLKPRGYVDTLFPGAFRREIFDRVGLFDEGAVTNEDAEINQRILQAGGRIYLSREIEVHYYPRDSLTGLASQYFRYGQGRARTLLKHRRFTRMRPALPFLALLIALVATAGGAAPGGPGRLRVRARGRPSRPRARPTASARRPC